MEQTTEKNPIAEDLEKVWKTLIGVSQAEIETLPERIREDVSRRIEKARADVDSIRSILDHAGISTELQNLSKV